MKKYFAIAAAVCAALVTMSCQKNDDGKGDEAKVSKRVATFSLVGDGWADVYQFTYDNDKVVKVFREEGKEWSLTYSDKNVKIVGKDVNYDCALNDMGFVSTLTDEWGDTFAFTYDKEGRITKIDKCVKNITTVTIEDGCIVTWTRIKDGETQTKNHKYISTKNVGDIHNIYPEVYPIAGRWMMETGLFGHGTAYLCGENQWAHSDAKGVLTYDTDADGFVTAEHKDYPDWPEEFAYTWEVVK